VPTADQLVEVLPQTPVRGLGALFEAAVIVLGIRLELPQPRPQLLALLLGLRHPGPDATNWRGEHATLYAVINHKIWGGNRTDKGADNRTILMSVLRTLQLRGNSRSSG
jgi:hypothetical protein